MFSVFIAPFFVVIQCVWVDVLFPTLQLVLSLWVGVVDLAGVEDLFLWDFLERFVLGL